MGRPEAMHLRDQLSPAFAGFVLDGVISNRDVIATILDLVIRGSIHLETKNTIPLQILKVKKLGEIALRPFEKKFLDELFDKKESLSLTEVQQKIHSNVLHKCIGENLEAILAFPLKGRKLRMYTRGGSPFMMGSGTDILDTEEELKRARRFDAPLILLVFGGSGALSLYFSLKSFSVMGALIGIVFIVIAVWIAYSLLFAKLSVDMSFKGTIPLMKKKYEELKDFLQKHPLKQQRLHNEFLAFSVAFGLDNSWLKSFGVGLEDTYVPFQEKDRATFDWMERTLNESIKRRKK